MHRQQNAHSTQTARHWQRPNVKNNAMIVRCIVNGKWITSRIKCFEFNSIFIGLMTSLWSWCCCCCSLLCIVCQCDELHSIDAHTHTHLVCIDENGVSMLCHDFCHFFCSPRQINCVFLTAHSIDINWIIWRWIIIKSAHRSLPHASNQYSFSFRFFDCCDYLNWTKLFSYASDMCFDLNALFHGLRRSRRSASKNKRSFLCYRR